MEARQALLCLPALAVILLVGIGSGHPGGALVACSGALSVGFGSFQRFTRHRNAPMLLAALGMALSAGLGSWVGRSEPALLAVSALWATGCAWLMAFGPGPWWIVLQWAIALFVAGANPAPLAGALTRAALVLLGGGLQLASIALLWQLLQPTPQRHVGCWRSYRRLARRKLAAANQALSYVVQAGAAVALALVAEDAVRLPNGYWAPMTALIVIKPGLRETWSRVLHRSVGTLAGAGVATLAAALLRPSESLSAILFLLFLWLAYALRTATYAIFTTSITACIVFLLALAGLPAPLNALHRISATLLGALIALGIGALADALARLRSPFSAHP